MDRRSKHTDSYPTQKCLYNNEVFHAVCMRVCKCIGSYYAGSGRTDGPVCLREEVVVNLINVNQPVIQ